MRYLSARVVLVLAVLLPRTAAAGEREIVAELARFLRATDAAERKQIVAQIAADPAYDRAKIHEWLHQAELFAPRPPGRVELDVTLPNGGRRALVLRVPAGYDPHRAWPVIYALHGSNGNGDWSIGYYAQVLGPRIDEFVVAAPTAYQEHTIHHPHWPPLGEHQALLRALREAVHVDSDRVYLTGYSLGAHTTWTQAVLMADQWAGALPLAGCFTLILPDKLWEEFVPNLQHLPLTCVWGAKDTSYGGERISPEGGVAGVNRRFAELAAQAGLPFRGVELPEAGHVEVVPPGDVLEDIFSRRRAHFPAEVQHTFRHEVQAHAYWLEGHAWAGSQWSQKQRTVHLREGENQLDDADFDEAMARGIRGDLARLAGRVAGQTIDVHRRKIKELTVWIGEGMIDWSQPVVLKVGGHEEYSGVLEPDLNVCLSQVARTWDFDRLYWAGLRFRSGSKTRLVDADTKFPTLGELLATDSETSRTQR